MRRNDLLAWCLAASVHLVLLLVAMLLVVETEISLDPPGTGIKVVPCTPRLQVDDWRGSRNASSPSSWSAHARMGGDYDVVDVGVAEDVWCARETPPGQPTRSKGSGRPSISSKGSRSLYITSYTYGSRTTVGSVGAVMEPLVRTRNPLRYARLGTRCESVYCPGVRGRKKAASVDDALGHLVEHQNEDGSWGGGDPAVTGIALLAFMKNGASDVEDNWSTIQPSAGEGASWRVAWHLAATRALRRLLNQQDADGWIAPHGAATSQAIAALALCVACQMTGAQALRLPAQRAIDCLPQGDSDKSWRTNWRLGALVYARDVVGLLVRAEIPTEVACEFDWLPSAGWDHSDDRFMSMALDACDSFAR